MDRFVKRCNHTGISQFEPHTQKFCNLFASSQIDTALKDTILLTIGGISTNILEDSCYLKFKNDSLNGTFPQIQNDLLEADRTDCLPLYGCVQQQNDDVRIPFRDPE